MRRIRVKRDDGAKSPSYQRLRTIAVEIPALYKMRWARSVSCSSADQQHIKLKTFLGHNEECRAACR